jgi:6-phosphogluconolactonase
MRELSLVLLLLAGCAASRNETGPPAGGTTGGSGGTGGAGATGGSAGTGGNAGTGGSAGTGGVSGSGGMAGGGSGGSPDAARDVGSAGTGGAPADAAPADSGTAPVAVKGFAYAAGAEFGGAQLTTFSLDLASGALARKGGGVAAGPSPDYVAVHPSGKFLFVNNETEAGRATAFAIGADGGLTMLNSAASGGGGPAHISVHSSGKWLLSANYNDGKLGVAQIAEDGKLTATSSVTAGDQAHMALDDGVTGNFVFVPCAAAGHVAMFKFDLATGKVTPNTPATIASANRPRHMAFNPNGKWAYVSHEGRAALTTFAYDPATGLLSAPKDTAAPADGAHVVAHPSGNFVFHIARGGDTVTVFKVGADGALSEASKVGSGGYDAAVTRDGKYLLVVSGTAVKVYRVDATSGALTAAGSAQAVNSSQSVAVF